MKIGILQIGEIDSSIIQRIQENLRMIFPKTTCNVIPKNLPIPEEAFDKARNQYFSGAILRKVQEFAEKDEALNRVLEIVDIDIFVPELNFVFGEAECPGKAALISLWRLKPEFYGEASNMELFLERSTKEAVHELGHTFGLRHCSNPFCVMYFSNSIFDTERRE